LDWYNHSDKEAALIGTSGCSRPGCGVFVHQKNGMSISIHKMGIF